jgi:hypothetical protein
MSILNSILHRRSFGDQGLKHVSFLNLGVYITKSRYLWCSSNLVFGKVSKDPCSVSLQRSVWYAKYLLVFWIHFVLIGIDTRSNLDHSVRIRRITAVEMGVGYVSGTMWNGVSRWHAGGERYLYWFAYRCLAAAVLLWIDGPMRLYKVVNDFLSFNFFVTRIIAPICRTHVWTQHRVYWESHLFGPCKTKRCLDAKMVCVLKF